MLFLLGVKSNCALLRREEYKTTKWHQFSLNLMKISKELDAQKKKNQSNQVEAAYAYALPSAAGESPPAAGAPVGTGPAGPAMPWCWGLLYPRPPVLLLLL